MIEDILLKRENHSILEFGRSLEVIQTAFLIDKRTELNDLL